MAKIKENAGFTLLEIMLVIVIISIGASVAIFSTRASMPDARLSAAARDIKSDLSLARLRAVKENRNVLVVFDNLNASYTIYVDANGDSAGSAGEAVKTVSMPEGVAMSCLLPASTATFNTRGLLATSVTTGLNDRIFLNNSNNNWRRVDLGLTGRSTILARTSSASDFKELH